MKKITLGLLFTCAIITNAHAQLPNSGFENWAMQSGIEEPDGWETFNQLNDSLGAPILVTKTTDAFAGTYAVQLTAQSYTDPSTNQPDSAYGTMLTGDINSNFTANYMGFPYNQLATSLNGHYKYAGVNGDSAMITVFLRKWDSSMNYSNMVGMGQRKLGNASAYTAFSVPISLFGNIPPDTAFIEISSANYTTSYHVGTVLKVDNLSFTTSTGVTEPLSGDDRISAYPNPSSGTVNIVSPYKGISTMRIFDANGRLVHSSQLQGKYELETGQWPEGLYLYHVIGESNEEIGKGKIIVAR
jgi:hypothetical protein